jgi:hypothetical protein
MVELENILAELWVNFGYPNRIFEPNTPYKLTFKFNLTTDYVCARLNFPKKHVSPEYDRV